MAAGWAISGCGEGKALSLPDNPFQGISLPGFLGGGNTGQKPSRRVAVGYRPSATAYPDSAPFDPTEEYPEYPYDERLGATATANESYALVREALRAWNPAGYGSAAWNPLSSTIRPGDTVIVKPNLVWEDWWDRSRVGLCTSHGSTTRAVIDYVYKACGRSGRIIVCDGTANAWAWPSVVRATQIDRLVEHLREAHGVPVQLLDLNAARESALLIKMGKDSAHYGLDHTLFDLHDRPDWHTANFGPGSYYVSPAVLQADVVISLAKMKVHRMAGVSAAMKNLFGIIPSWDGPYGDDRLKDVPHYSALDKKEGNAGIYPGNDTVWRTIADLNRIALYSDQYGALRASPRRRYLGIVDGLLAAGRDMLNPVAVPLKTLVIGEEPVSVDAVAARVMGYDPRRIKSIALAAGVDGYALGPSDAKSIELALEGAEGLAQVNDGRSIVPPDAGAYSWKGYIEASDFAPPTLLEASTVNSQIAVKLEDDSGVEFARIHYTSAGRRYDKELKLTGPASTGGVWRVEVDGESDLADVVLEAGDLLFNVARYKLADLEG